MTCEAPSDPRPTPTLKAMLGSIPIGPDESIARISAPTGTWVSAWAPVAQDPPPDLATILQEALDIVEDFEAEDLLLSDAKESPRHPSQTSNSSNADGGRQ